jgi:rhamnose transport system substrate-binding protein
MKKQIRAIGLVLTAVLMLALASCGSGGGNTGKNANLNIVFLPKAVNNPYEVVAGEGGQKAANQLGGGFKYVGPSEATAPAQLPWINTFTEQQVSAIVVAANDPNALVPALKRSMSRGIKVVAFDSDVAPGGRNVFVNQANSEDIGRIEVQMLGKEIGYQGKFAILSAASTATNQNTWISFMQNELTKPQYKGMQLVKIVYGNDDDQASYEDTLGLLQAYPDLKGIISPTTVGIAASARALEASGHAGKVALTGLGTPNLMRKFVKDGTVKQFALWDVSNLGYLAYYTAAALAQGKITGKPGETYDAGKLGKKTIGANNEVVLGPPTIFNKDNIDQYHF